MFINNPGVNCYHVLSRSEMKTEVGNSRDVKLQRDIIETKLHNKVGLIHEMYENQDKLGM